MSEHKKARVIHVDKLIVHADEVVIIPKRRLHDPWFSPRRDRDEDVEEIQENVADDNDGERRPFSWI
ncbi:hypothetical protein GGR02_002991 [Anoxybacillus voinovskiensis]|uniref:Uncharacterized protein n=1 Tax=Anoxybacteroides voinovskiense TaxID=230470 RepID=A0A840DQ30_9BACL|nr:hypothetical protein [Anoxybacillus voinovskiensis]MBB4075174.1 hypothetical protein [Anoxybacillus voinovskiensis]GGJ76916.1 hypothetical protein GCM10008982_27800 [Anoxybacillus voinovskiensis]